VAGINSQLMEERSVEAEVGGCCMVGHYKLLLEEMGKETCWVIA